MKKLAFLHNLIVALFSFCIFSCSDQGVTTGYLSGKDEEPPKIKILSPAINDAATDTLILKAEILDVSGIQSVNLQIQDATDRYSYERFYDQNDIYTFKVNIALLSGVTTLTVLATDATGQKSSQSVQITIKPTVYHIYKFKSTNELSINTILHDNSGTVWIATFNGLWKYAGNLLNRYPLGFNQTYSVVHSMGCDKTNTLWMQVSIRYSSETPRMASYNGASSNIYSYIPSQNSYPSSVSGLQVDANDTLCGVFNYSSTMFSFKNDKWKFNYLGGNSICGFKIDKLNRKWIANYSDVKYQDQTGWHSVGVAGGSYYGLWLDADDNVWCINYIYDKTSKISKFSNGAWTSYTVNATGKNIYDMGFDTNGDVWVATDQSINRYDKNMQFKRSYPFVSKQIHIDSENRVWFVDEWGLYYLKTI
ncbi:MAG: hypothetical protein HYV28_19565 [Ignavibacteriales bacterium]|nr:hypothetical protein [Ignavibacteriales bacterium]